jgi:hypothetical protein
MAFQDEDELYDDDEELGDDDGLCEVCGLYSCDCGFEFDQDEYFD